MICSCKISDGAHKEKVRSLYLRPPRPSYLRHTSLRHVTPSSPSPAPFVPLVLFLIMLFRLTDCQPRRIRHPFDSPETVIYTHFQPLPARPHRLAPVLSKLGAVGVAARSVCSFVPVRFLCPPPPDSWPFVFFASIVSSSLAFFFVAISSLGLLHNAQTWAPHYSSARFVCN